MRLFWHRRDLRTRDNVGLAAATNDTVVPVFVVDTDLFDAVGDRQQAFFLRGVDRLRDRYRDLGSDLVVRSGDPSAVLPELATAFDADGVVWNDHYRPARRTRARQVREALTDINVDAAGHTDLVLVDPGRLDPAYPNHGRFHDDWQAIQKHAPASEPGPDALADVTDDGAIPTVEADIELPAAGYDAARARYDTFLDDGIDTYRDTRDDLSLAVEQPTQAVSRMSPFLAAGMIGIRELWADTTHIYDAADGDRRRNVSKYRDELSWREQYYHLLYYNSELATSNYKSMPNEIAWRDDPDGFAAWKAGETGYPLVDAGMRQLNAEGHVHNRPRQVVASFLTKHLLIDWREGARYFTEQLVDHDHAVNHGNWQWIASTGTDSVDVRIFDPVSQMAKYDQDADFVKTYVPELRDVPAEPIVDWPTLPADERAALSATYPDPIVDRDGAYERAQRVFERALGQR